MSSPLCANCSRDASRAGLGMGPVALTRAKRQVGSGVEEMCSQFEVTGPVVKEGSVPVGIGPVVEIIGCVVELTGTEAREVASLVEQAVTLDGSSYRLEGHSVCVDPEEMLSSVGEVRGSVVEMVFFAILAVPSVAHIGLTVLACLVSEVRLVAESVGPVVRVGPGVQVKDPVVETGGDPVLALLESIPASHWLNSTGLLGYACSGLATGIVGDVGSGLVPGLRGYGASNRLPTEREKEEIMSKQ